ncbi:hypothetical protein D3C86_1413080 [compost metagenome]
MPVPGTELRRIQGQVEAFLAVLEGVFGGFAFGGVEKSAQQIGLALELDFLRTEDAVMDLAVAGTKLHFHADHIAFGFSGLDQIGPLLGVYPQPQFQGGAPDRVLHRPTEQAFEILVGFGDQAVFLAGQQDHVRAQVKQGGEALFRAAQGLLTLALVSDLADHANHPRPAMLVRQQAAADFQPVQAAVGPADAVVHGLLQWRAANDRMKGTNGFGAILGWQQVEVFQVMGQRLPWIEPEQRLRAPGPADLPALDVPIPGAQARTVERGQQLRGAFPALFGAFRINCLDTRHRRNTVYRFRHWQALGWCWAFVAGIRGSIGVAQVSLESLADRVERPARP